MKLAGQTALVTGATRGIGQAIALAFAAEGAAVAVTGRDSEALEAVGADLRLRGGQVVTVAADLAERGAVDRLVASGRFVRPRHRPVQRSIVPGWPPIRTIPDG